jgi:hypothetical protein
MKVIITENQYSIILIESKKEKIPIKLKKVKVFSETVLSKAQEEMGVSLKMLFTWSAAVGGILTPLDDFISKGNFNLTPYQATSILVAVVAIIFGESKRSINKLLKIIKEENITDDFNKVLSKAEELKSVFLDFMESLNVATYTMTNILSYAFLIPVLPILWEISQTGFNIKETEEIIVRILAFGLTSISGNLLKSIISKIIKRFRE